MKSKSVNKYLDQDKELFSTDTSAMPRPKRAVSEAERAVYYIFPTKLFRFELMFKIILEAARCWVALYGL